MAPVLRGEAARVKRPEDYLVVQQAVDREAQSALRLGRWKLIKTWASGLLELFDLAVDPSETRNLAEEQPRQATRLHVMMIQYLSEVAAETRATEE